MPAQQGSGEGVEQDARHHVRIEIDDRCDHHAANRADRRGKAPAQRQHPTDANAHQPGRYRIECGGAHGEPQLGVAEKQIDRDQHDQGHGKGAEFVARDITAEQQRTAGEWRRKGLDHVIEHPAGTGVDDQQQADEHADRGEYRRIHHRPHQNALDQHAQDERDHHRNKEGNPVRQAGIDQGKGDVGGQRRHLALGEVHVMRRLVDHHQRQRDGRVNAATGDAGQDLVQHAFHLSAPALSRAGAPSG